MRQDRTSELRGLLSPPIAGSSSRSSSTSYPPPETSSNLIKPKRLRRRDGKSSPEHAEEERWTREFLREAYSLYDHLRRLGDHLSKIRNAYLNTTRSGPQYARSTANKNDASSTDLGRGDDGILKRLEKARWLSDREIDEVDLRTKVVLRACRDRVGLLEAREKSRQNKQNSSLAHQASSFLHNLLPSLGSSEASSEDPYDPRLVSAILQAHNGSILWSLNHALLEVSERQKSLQEERVALRLERGRNLGSLVGGQTGEGQNAGSGVWTATNGNSVSIPPPVNLTVPVDIDDDDDDDQGDTARQLSPQQMQALSTENADMLSAMQSTLNSVLQAETSLNDIAQLQSSLVAHLTSQAETIDRLYDDAIASVGDVERTNVELRKARERGGEARLMLLVFLIGSSLALLFVDWYK